MRIVHIATIDKGGAYNAARRLSEMFTRHGHDSKILVRTKTGDDECVIPVFDTKVKEIISKSKNVINLLCKKGEIKRDVLGTDLCDDQYVKEADVIFIHWISTFLSPKEICRLSQLPNKKVIFVMHDMWLFTGGCHVDKRCGGYTSECRACPLLYTDDRVRKRYTGLAAHRSFTRKASYIQRSDMIVTGPSRWIVEEAGKSAILNGKVPQYMPNTLDTDIFRPNDDKASLRAKYDILPDKKVILFAAADTGTGNENKGFKYLTEALAQTDNKDIVLGIIGNTGSRSSLDDAFKRYDIKTFGYVTDEYTLAEIYNLGDVFVNPSLQESFGYTVCESMSCGTPAVAFAVGGMLDQIEHKVNGYLAGFRDSIDLARGIEYVLKHHEEISPKARESAKRFSYDNVYAGVMEILI